MTQPTPRLWTFPREEFLAERWDYRPGEHVAFLAPTQSGKTTLAFQLLERTASKRLQAVVLVAKPRDRVVNRWGKQLGLKTVRTWPPLLSRVLEPPPGWILWPKHVFDPAIDRPNLYYAFREAILECYKTKRPRILFADEFYILCVLLGLEEETTEILASGSSMDTGGWFATQKPSHVSTWLYSNSDHLFLGYDADERNRKRFGEIGGVDAKLVSESVKSLNEYQWLYIRRRGRVMCIVDK